MEISIKSFVLFGAVVLTGLSAGFFYAWQVSVIQGTLLVKDAVYLETMQSINRAILNPWFFAVFFGSLIFLSIGSIYQFNTNKWVFVMLLAASIIYLIGTFGITAAGNVPLNDQLEALNLSELTSEKMAEFRSYYETKWNRLHLQRTVCSVLSFVLAVLALFVEFKK
ncbi:MAG TPA: anthrone oxygenase family protein [Cryomorphaceae bacterium]|nr:anthrone oxygenase family protein [Cryomorphaceae bacterium]